MKRLFAIFIGLVSVLTASAQEAPKEEFKNRNLNGVISIERKDLVKIKYGQLPAAVRKTLEESDYKTWSVVAIFRTKQSDKFLLDLNDGKETTAHWFDKTGTMLKQDAEDPALRVSSLH